MKPSRSGLVWLACAIMVSAGAAEGLTAQDARVPAQDARLRARLDPATADSITMILEMARGNAVPVEPLIQTALEGASKQASAAEIMKAVGSLAARLSIARQTLGAQATEPELVAAASALFSGVDANTLRHIQTLNPRGSIAMPLVSLSYFIRSGVDRSRAVQWIELVVRRGVDSEELLRLHQAIQGDIRSGASAHAATEARVQALLRKHAQGDR